MSETNDKDSPRIINEGFWLGWAVKVVETTASKIDEGALRVASAMGWFWTAYTAVVLAASISQTWYLSEGQRLVIAAPAILLFAAYSLATWASLPVRVKFDPREPWDVKASYDRTVRLKWIRLVSCFTVGAVAAVAVGSVIFSALAKSPLPVQNVQIDFGAEGRSVLVGGTISPAATATIEVAPAGGDILQAITQADKDGLIQLEVDVPKATKYSVSIRWQAEQYQFIIGRKLVK